MSNRLDIVKVALVGLRFKQNQRVVDTKHEM